MMDEVLTQMSPRFDATGRPSIGPEKLLRALLVQMLYSTRSERLSMEEIDYSLLFRWFVGLNLDEALWDTTPSRDRLLEAGVAKEFLVKVVAGARAKGLTSDEHSTVDGTVLKGRAKVKSFQPEDGNHPPAPDDSGNPTVKVHGERRSNLTHQSKTDQNAKLAFAWPILNQDRAPPSL
jgi:transposase